MKKFIILSLILLGFLSTCLAAEIQYGSLNVFSKMPGTKLYVDGKVEGTNSIQIKKIQAGTHFLKVTTGGATAEATLYAEIIEIKAGEVTTIYVTEKGLEGSKIGAAAGESVDVFKAKRIFDYSKEMHTGWYIKLGYLSNLYYNIHSSNLDNYASTFGLGLGFKIPLAPNIDFDLEMERAQLTSSKQTWYFMPITANISISYLPSAYFRGKQYYGLGIGYYMTDLTAHDENNVDTKQNLTTMGYHLFYGLEMPMGDKNALFFQFGYHAADMNRYNYIMNSSYVSVGYRWDVKE